MPQRKLKWYSTAEGTKKVGKLLREKKEKRSMLEFAKFARDLRQQKPSAESSPSKKLRRIKARIAGRASTPSSRATLNIVFDRLGIKNPMLLRQLKSVLWDMERYAFSKRAHFLAKKKREELVALLEKNGINSKSFLTMLQYTHEQLTRK